MPKSFRARFCIEFSFAGLVVAAALCLMPSHLACQLVFGPPVVMPVSTAVATDASIDSLGVTLNGLPATAGSAQTDGTTVFFLNGTSSSACDATARIDSTPVAKGAITAFVTSATPLEAAQPGAAPTSLCGPPVISGAALFVRGSYSLTPMAVRTGIFRFPTAGGPGVDVLATGDVVAGAGNVTTVSAAVSDGKGGVFVPFTTATGSYLFASANGSVIAPANSSCNGVSITNATPAPGQSDGTMYASLVAAMDIASGKSVTVVTSSATKPSADCNDVLFNPSVNTAVTPIETVVANGAVYLSGAPSATTIGIYKLSTAGVLTKVIVTSDPVQLPPGVLLSLNAYGYAPDSGFTVAGPFLVFKETITMVHCNDNLGGSTTCHAGYPGGQALYSVYLPTGNIRVITNPATNVSALFAPGAGSVTASGVAVYNVSTPTPLLSTISIAGIPTATTLKAPATSLSAPVTLSATVTPNILDSATATGTVRFLDGSTLLGTGSLDSTGAASISVSLAPGTHTITAAYSGDSAFLRSTSLGSRIVSGIATSLTLVASQDVILPGEQFSITAHVVPSQTSTNGVPTGSVLFSCNGAASTVALAPGTGDFVATTTCTAQTVPITNYTTATYSGDANYQTGTGTATFVIGYNSGIQVISSPVRVSLGGTATLTVKVSNISAGFTGIIPVGTVTTNCFPASAPVAVDATGSATVTCPMMQSSPGTENITVTFSGPLYNASSTLSVVQVGNAYFDVGGGPLNNNGWAPGTAQYNISVLGYAGFSSPVTLGCTGLPVGVSCSFSPGTVTPVGLIPAGESTLTIAATLATAALDPSGLPSFFPGVSVALLLPFLFGVSRRKLRLPGVLLLLLCLLPGSLSLAGCAGGASSAATSNPLRTTPSGTYNITITATSGTTVETTVMSFTVN